MELERRGLLNLVAEQEEPVPARPGAPVAAVCGGHENGKWELLVDSTISPSHVPFHSHWGVALSFISSLQNIAWSGQRGPNAGPRDPLTFSLMDLGLTSPP